MIELDPAEYIVRGGHRFIFAHPNCTSKLIKVQRTRPTNPHERFPARRAGIYSNMYEEIGEYLVLRSRDKNSEPLVAPIHGLIETSLGLGLEVARINGPDGNLAPTLTKLIAENRVTENLQRSIDALAHRLLSLGVVVCDFVPDNLVLRPDQDGFCIVDGLGEYDPNRKTRFLPFRKFSRLCYNITLRRQVRVIHEKIKSERGVG